MENNVFNTQLGNLNTTNSFSSNFTFFCRNFLFLPSNINLYNHKKGRNLVWGVGGGSFCSKCEKFVKREILGFSNISWWKSCNFYSFYLFLKISSRWGGGIMTCLSHLLIFRISNNKIADTFNFLLSFDYQ